MRFASVIDDGGWLDVVVRDGTYLPLDPEDTGFGGIRGIAAGGASALSRVTAWVHAQPDGAWRSLEGVEEIGTPIEPGSIFTIGENYRSPGATTDSKPLRPLVYGKAAASAMTGGPSTVSWDRELSPNVDAECELGIVIGELAWQVQAADAMRHVFGYTIVNDISSRDPWLDGDQWLLGKSMNGFCPVGPWIVTANELDPSDLRLGCTINGEAIQDGRTADMRFSIEEIIAYLSRHLTLSPGDLIATGTPARLATPPGPDRHLQAGDVVTAWIEGIGELTTTVA